MGSHVEAETVSRLTVAQLKSYLASVGVDNTAGMRKAQLVEEVYKYYKK